MAIDNVREYLKPFGLDKNILEFEVSSATVALAAKALGTEEARIAKTLSLEAKDDACILIVAAGDVKIDNHKFKETFGFKAKMLSFDDVLAKTGHAAGGVCPFANPEGTQVWLDESLKRFETVFPACGSANSAIELAPETLFDISNALGFVDVCKPIAPVAE